VGSGRCCHACELRVGSRDGHAHRAFTAPKRSGSNAAARILP
jgi:hypothetical protein